MKNDTKYNSKTKKVYKSILEQLKEVDENQLALVDGAILEAARLKVELDDLNELVKQTGLIKFDPNNLTRQKELPVSKMITKVRANYLSYICKLSNLLGKTITDDDEEDDLEGYE